MDSDGEDDRGVGGVGILDRRCTIEPWLTDVLMIDWDEPRGRGMMILDNLGDGGALVAGGALGADRPGDDEGEGVGRGGRGASCFRGVPGTRYVKVGSACSSRACSASEGWNRSP
jgi:hypothetical protein